MRFGPVPMAEAMGAILVHSLDRPALRKGRVLSAADVAALRAAGVTTVTVARLEPGDVGEDEAARRIAALLAGPGLTAAAAFTGRVNLYAARDGLLDLDRERIDALNRLDESVTVATLPPLAPVKAGQMAATVKIIPFSVPAEIISDAEQMIGAPPLRVAGWRGCRAGLVQTLLPGLKSSVQEKAVSVTARRLAAVGARLVAEQRVPHSADAVAAALAALRDAGCDLLLVIGASAITDRRDVLPAGLTAAGGDILQFGMPVDPGNLLLLGRLGELPVLGLPGCARSPKLNGVDWVLQRLAAGLPVGRAELTAMGVGGLLAEIPGRPQPRAEVAARFPRIAALVLAAGHSRRLGRNKLLEPLDGRPLLTHAVDAALTSQAASVLVVTGHEAADVRAALGSRPVRLVQAEDHAAGMSASLKAGLAALPPDMDGVLVLLGDMPLVGAPVLDRLIASWSPAEGRSICVPTHDGHRGNPVLWDRRYVAEMMALEGDTGARALLHTHADAVCEVAMAEDGILLDADTPAALALLAHRISAAPAPAPGRPAAAPASAAAPAPACPAG